MHPAKAAKLAPRTRHTQKQRPPSRANADDAQDTRLVTLPDGTQRPVLCTQRVWDAYDALVESTEDAARVLPEQANDLAERDGISFEDAFAHLVIGAHQAFTASS
jgi:hypothetical protein